MGSGLIWIYYTDKDGLIWINEKIEFPYERVIF